VSTRDLVVIGASAGGVESLRILVSGLPQDFPAAVLVVLHVPPGARSALPSILDRSGPLSAKQAEEGDQLRAGQLLVAGPDQHLIVVGDRVSVSRGPTENGHRPAVDVLFRSAAQVAGRRVIGVVLSGALDDGTAGLADIRSRGGLGVVQDPAEALHSGMPRSAIEGAGAEHVVPVADMPALLTQLSTEEIEAEDNSPAPDLMNTELALAAMHPQAYDSLERPGDPVSLSCPDCDGTLARLGDDNVLRFRCRVGHAWSAESLLTRQESAAEAALWMALRNLEERASLTQDMSRRAGERGHRRTARMFQSQADEALHGARLVREVLTRETGALADLHLDTETGEA